MLQLTKEQLRELYKERDEALFFDYKPLKKVGRRNFVKTNKVMLDELPEVFNHFISVRSFISNYNNLQKNAKAKSSWVKDSSKQVVIKTLSNLDKIGAKNALSYVIRNSDNDFALNQDGEPQSLREIMKDWSKDFTHKKNAKEVLHLAFCIDEQNDEYHTNEIKLKRAVEAVMQKNFYLYKYAMVIHSHQSKPHAHILLNKNNILDGQKFHLSNAEFKLFFNQLRNDFAMALNTQGLKYHNHYKIEQDLNKIQNQIKENNFTSKLNVFDELTRLEISINKKIKAQDKKVLSLKDDLQDLNAKRNEIIKELIRLKNIDILHKGLWKVFKDFKEINTLIADKKESIAAINKKQKGLRADLKKIDYEKYTLRAEQDKEFSALIQKQRYLDFITTNLDRKSLTKSEINLKIKAIQDDITLNQQTASETLKTRIKASLMTSALLDKNNNGFTLARAYKDLEKNLILLKECGLKMQDEVWQDEKDREKAQEYFTNYQQRLENNQSLLLELINQRFLLLQQELENKKQSKRLKIYQVKEYEKISKFLSKNNEQEIQSLYKLIDDINSSGGTAQSFNGGKEQQATQQEKSSQAQENNTQSQTKPNENTPQQTNDKAQTQTKEQTSQNNLNQKMQQSGFTIRR